MNIVDFIILMVMSIGIVFGMYNGLILSALHTASFFLSWLTSLILYPKLTEIVLEKFPSLLNMITLYTEGSAQIPTIEEKIANIRTFTPEMLEKIVEKVQLPIPFNRIIIADFSHSLENVQTLGEYFDSTMAIAVINIFSFVILFLLAKVIFTVIISIGKTVANLPVLKKCDSLAGGAFGIVRGIFMVYLVFALVPILLVLAPIDLIKESLDGSKLADFFLNTNIFTSFVKGWF